MGLRVEDSFMLKRLIVFVGLVCVSCTTVKTAPQRGGEEIQPIVPVSKPQLPKAGPVSGVLLAHSFVKSGETVSREGCRLRVENLSTKKHYFLVIKPRGPAVFSPLEPGSYRMRRLGCGVTKVWDLSEIANFDVMPGQVSYIGKETFVFDPEGELAEVQKASRLESAEALVAALDQVPQAARESLVSGYTLKPITKAMREGELREGFDVFGQGTSNPNEILAPLVAKLKICSNDAAKIDPLRIGSLKIVALYKDGRFVGIKEKSGENALSDQFVKCIEQAHEAFAPAEKGELEVRTRL
jgi:hypothetical protein